MPKHFPDWIPTVELPKRGGTVRHVVIDSVEALQYVVNQGTISVHVLGGTVSAPDVPAELLIDLDPSIDDPAQVVEATAAVRVLRRPGGSSASSKPAAPVASTCTSPSGVMPASTRSGPSPTAWPRCWPTGTPIC